MSDIHSPEPEAPEPPAPPVPAAGPTTPTAPPVTPAPTPPKSGIAIAALVLGIVAAVFAIIPGPSFGAFVPAILAAVLGIVALTRETPRRGFALAGIILGAVSLLVAIIVSIVAGAALTSRTSALDGGTNSGSASSSAATLAAKPTLTPTPTVVPVPADLVLTGHGDAVIKASAVDGADEPGVATITHDGKSNFAVWSLDANVTQLDLLVNTIGAYNGTVLFGKQSTQHTESLQITADGNWTVTLHSIRALRTFDATGTTGHGDDVLIYRGNAGAATLTHDGSSNFAVWTYGDQTNLVVNQIGAYNGTVRWTKGPEIVTVTADGNWSIALQ